MIAGRKIEAKLEQNTAQKSYSGDELSESHQFLDKCVTPRKTFADTKNLNGEVYSFKKKSEALAYLLFLTYELGNLNS